MRRTLFVTLIILFAGIVSVCAQDKPAVPQPQTKPAESPAQDKSSTSQPAGNAKSCLIVKHKGTVGRRLLWTALIAVPIAPGTKYDHVDAINFQKAKPAYKGKELQEFQAEGVRVMILEKNYKQENLDSARNACREPESPPTQPKQEPKPPEQKQEGKPPALSETSQIGESLAGFLLWWRTNR